MNRIYICIDLKSFYASVECVERGLDPLHTNLVVADKSRTEKTICLAVSPSLKKYGIPGRARLYEVVQKVKEVNEERKKMNYGYDFTGRSYLEYDLDNNYDLELDYIVAPPRMKYYMDYSAKIFDIYLRYVSSEDIYSYSIDEVFCDITDYLKTYKKTPRELITEMIKAVYEETGITATGGIGTNMYLAKIAMDIVAKHMDANEYGVRIAGLDEATYKKLLWTHRPITDFWRVGKGIAKRLESNKMYTMGDVARCSIENEDLLYKLFGVNAEFLIDHAWGYETCTIKDAKSYRPISNSMSVGQVLHKPYDYSHTKLIVKEMTDNLVLDLVNRRLVTDQIVLEIGYDISNLKFYTGEVKEDFYGRKVPKHAHGTIRIDHKTSSSRVILPLVLELYDKIINKDLYVRRINVVFSSIYKKSKCNVESEQLNLFTNYEERDKQILEEEHDENLEKVLIDIKGKYGKNAILKGMNLMEGGTAIERNKQVGGHKE